MPSTSSRGQIVTDALSLAGRSQELKQSCNQWLNYFLRDVGLTFRFPELRKVGSPQTLAIGQSTAALPADFGAGMEKLGMIFGPDNKPLSEMSYEEFANTNGFPVGGAGSGRPYLYIVDLNARVFRFNGVADQAYLFTPTYFTQPPLLDVATSQDSQSVWLDNDMIAVQGLIWMIYQFTDDPREEAQEARVDRMLKKWQRETVKMGGTSRVLLSPARFKTIKFGGFHGP